MRRPDLSDRDYDQYFDHVCRQFSGLEASWDRWDPRYGRNWSATCDAGRAQAAIGALDGVGFLEDFQGVLRLLAGLLRPRRRSAALENATRAAAGSARYRAGQSKSPGFQRLPERLRRAIRRANRADAALYRWAAAALAGPPRAVC